MSSRKFSGIESAIAVAILGCAFLASPVLHAQTSDGQSKPPFPGSAAPNVASVLEFPVTMRQNVVAGKTPAGTKVEAKLTMATLVKGTVIPEGAIFSGEVVDSAAKSKTEPSHLVVRMYSVQWKKESLPITVYLTAWYYPLLMGQDAQMDAQTKDPTFENPAENPVMRTANGGLAGPRTLPPDVFAPASRLSDTRVAMKNIESTRNADGTIALTSTKSNIKLDKSTTYVLATGELTAGK